MAKEFEQPIIEDSEEYRDHLATVDAGGNRIWLYPKKPKGRYYNARTWVSVGFLILFLGLPFIKVHGDPLFLFNILERRFILFGSVFTPQDFVLFGLYMITFLVFIILFTIVYGRLFCGWVCPQTVFMELIFRKVEYWIEGDYTQQRKLDASAWTGEKFRKKVLKHAIFFTIAVITANFFLAYVIGMDEVLKIIRDPISQHAGGFGAMILFSFIFYGVYSRMREQICTQICPYGRMQGVLLVKDTIVVAYDHVRGEPRGKLKKSAGATAQETENTNLVSNIATAATSLNQPQLGDCVDCKLCIAVCPTGIDIRNGTQLECTNCTACMDACDEVMDKVKRPRGLIRYDSLTGIEQGRKSVWTTRVKAYSLVLLALIGIDAALILTRDPVETIILRSPGQLYQEVDATHVSNLYTYQIINKTAHEMPVTLRLATPGGTVEFVAAEPTSVKKDSLSQGAFFVKMENSALQSRKTPIVIEVFSGDKKIDEVKTNFMGPKK